MPIESFQRTSRERNASSQQGTWFETTTSKPITNRAPTFRFEVGVSRRGALVLAVSYARAPCREMPTPSGSASFSPIFDSGENAPSHSSLAHGDQSKLIGSRLQAERCGLLHHFACKNSAFWGTCTTNQSASSTRRAMARGTVSGNPSTPGMSLLSSNIQSPASVSRKSSPRTSA